MAVAAVAAAAAPKTKEKEKKKTRKRTQPRAQRPWNVIVHDDPVTLMSYVTRAFMEVFHYPQPKAHKLMMEVHTQGRSVVWTGSREKAETYVAKLHGYHLLATLERIDAG